MKKDIFDMLNDSDINLDDYKKEEMNDIEKMKMKKFVKKMTKKKKKSKLAKVAGVCAIVGAGLLITPYGQDVIASINLPTYEIGYFFGGNRDLDDYKTVIDQSITDKGVTIKLNEVILDGDMLLVSSTTHIENKEKQFRNISMYGDVYINGKSVSDSGGGTGALIEENTFADEGEYGIDLSKVDLTKPLDIRIALREVWASTEQEEGVLNPIRGSWDFEFTVDPSEIIADTKVIEPNIEVKDGDEAIIIEKYTSNKVGQKIYVKYGENTLEDCSLDFVGTDNLGNKVEFDGRYRKGNEGMFEINQLDGGLSDEATEIRLQGVYKVYPKGGGKMPDEYTNFGEPFTIKLK